MSLDDKLKDLWANNKLVFMLVVIPLGLVILAYKFRSILIDLLVSDGKKIAIDTEKKDKDLAVQQAAATAAADQLVKQANDLPKDKPEVTEDWYKK